MDIVKQILGSFSGTLFAVGEESSAAGRIERSELPAFRSRAGAGQAAMNVPALAAALLVGLLTLEPAMARGPWRASEANTQGWQLMTPEERIEHQARIRGFATLAECRSYQLSHHQLMEERARQRGIALPKDGRDICEHLEPAKPKPKP